jgi:hypothetical protein
MSSTIALVTDRNSTTTATWTFRTITHNGASAPTIGTASSAVTTIDERTQPLLSKIDATNAFAVYSAASTQYAVARVITISGASAPTLQTANTSSAIVITDQLSFALHKISSSEFIVFGHLGILNYTVSSTTVSYTGHVIPNQISGLLSQLPRIGRFVSLGNDIIILRAADDSSIPFDLLKKLGSYVYPAQKQFGFGKQFFSYWDSRDSSCFLMGLDSTTVLGLTNNNSSTISATIIKYIG